MEAGTFADLPGDKKDDLQFVMLKESWRSDHGLCEAARLRQEMRADAGLSESIDGRHACAQCMMLRR